MSKYVFKLPDVGEGTAEAEIVAWHVAVGDRVNEDQQLVDVMTDKATVEMTSPVAGTIVALKGNPGEMATVGAPLVEFELEGAVNVAPADKTAAPPEATPDAPPENASAKPLAAPAVRLRAADLRVDLRQVRGTGPGGRITHGDLDDFLTHTGKKPRPPGALPRRNTKTSS